MLQRIIKIIMDISTAEIQDNIMDQEEPKTSPLSATAPKPPINVTSFPIKRDTIQTGTSSFAKLVQHDSFVDKTILIKEFIKSGETVILITCPRRFGKSTNMDMIKTFLEIEVDKNGELIPEKDKQNHKLFTERNLLISKDTEFKKQHLGQYPVISVSFKDVRGSNYQEILNIVKTSINNTFIQHEYMINALNRLSKDGETLLDREEAKDCLTNFLKIYKNCAQDTTKEEIENSLKFLSELLYNHFNKKVYVLIDEYDTPIDSIMRDGFKDDVSSTNKFIDLMLGSVLKDNDSYLEKGLITGISVIAKNSSKLNNVAAHRFLDNHLYAQYYGFTNDDILNLVNKNELDDVTKYYNGYLVIDQSLPIYNPWSIMKYMQTGKIVNYWCQSGPIEHIQKLFKYDKMRQKFNLLKKDQGISFQFQNTPKIQDIQNLQKVLNCSERNIEESHINLFFSYIFEHGYLTPVKTTGIQTFNHNYKIPNQEIEQEFAQNAIDYYVDSYKLNNDCVEFTIATLKSIINSYDNDLNLSNKMNNLASSIQKLCQDLTFVQITAIEDGSHPNESLLHTIVGWIIIQSDARKFGSEVPINTGMSLGKADIAATYKELGIIIELKYNKTAENVLQQIKEKNYDAIFSKLPHIKKILNIGINLSSSKKVTIAYDPPFNNDNPSGNGINNKYDYTTLLYHESWNKYYLDGMKKILELRIKDLPVSTQEKVVILTDPEYQLTQDSTGVHQILKDLLLLNPKTNEIVLLPYNIHNKHWVGLIITKDHNDSYQIKYLDSEVTSIPAQLIEDLKLVSNNLDIQINISEANVEQQKYNNCGPEVVENFIQALTSSRLPQEQAVIYHSKLVQNNLLTNLYLEDFSIGVLGSNIVQQFQIGSIPYFDLSC